MKYTKTVDSDLQNIIYDYNVTDLKRTIQDKTFMITGASGMIGSYICYLLIKMNELFNTNM